MDIHFEGFQQSISLFWVVLLLLGAMGLSYWTYRHVEGLTPLYRRLLTTLRALSFIILLLLLLNPVIALRENITHPVRIALLLDNSQSVTVEKGDYSGTDSYESVIGQLMPGNEERFANLVIEPYAFDSELFPLESSLDLDYEGTRTDIDQALAEFMDIMEREETIILVSDGIVTSGRDPSSIASRMPVPIFTIGIGDTARHNDIVVQRVSNNPTASLNSTLTVEASILNEGFPDQDIEVQLRRNDEVLHDTTIRSSESRSVQQVRFDLALEEEGLQQYQIHVPEIEGEWTTENNTRYFSVDVRDDRIRVLHLAYGIHPDVRNIRHFLREDQQISLESRTWISHDRYVEGDLPDRPDTLDLVILQGFPHVDLPSDEASAVSDRFGDNALMIMGMAGQDVTRLSSLFPGLMPLQFESDHAWYETRFDLSSDQSSHAILDFELPDDLRMNPVMGGIRHVSPNSGAHVLLHSVYRGNVTDAPLLAVRSIGDRHVSHLHGFGFYRWAQSTRDENRIFWENLLNNIVKWTAASPDEELLELSPADPVFQIGEPVLINAFLRNEAGDPETNGVIELELESDNTEARRYVMSNEGGGRYQLEIDNLPEGTYHYQGSASRGDREIDNRSGQFVIGGVNREFLNTVRDNELLEQLARLSGGVFLPHDRAGELLDMLEDQLGFDERVETVSQSFALHRHPFWFILLIVLLTLEWSIRKYRALA